MNRDRVQLVFDYGHQETPIGVGGSGNGRGRGHFRGRGGQGQGARGRGGRDYGHGYNNTNDYDRRQRNASSSASSNSNRDFNRRRDRREPSPPSVPLSPDAYHQPSYDPTSYDRRRSPVEYYNGGYPPYDCTPPYSSGRSRSPSEDAFDRRPDRLFGDPFLSSALPLSPDQEEEEFARRERRHFTPVDDEEGRRPVSENSYHGRSLSTEPLHRPHSGEGGHGYRDFSRRREEDQGDDRRERRDYNYSHNRDGYRRDNSTENRNRSNRRSPRKNRSRSRPRSTRPSKRARQGHQSSAPSSRPPSTSPPPNDREPGNDSSDWEEEASAHKSNNPTPRPPLLPLPPLPPSLFEPSTSLSPGGDDDNGQHLPHLPDPRLNKSRLYFGRKDGENTPNNTHTSEQMAPALLEQAERSHREIRITRREEGNEKETDGSGCGTDKRPSLPLPPKADQSKPTNVLYVQPKEVTSPTKSNKDGKDREKESKERRRRSSSPSPKKSRESGSKSAGKESSSCDLEITTKNSSEATVEELPPEAIEKSPDLGHTLVSETEEIPQIAAHNQNAEQTEDEILTSSSSDTDDKSEDKENQNTQLNEDNDNGKEPQIQDKDTNVSETFKDTHSNEEQIVNVDTPNDNSKVSSAHAVDILHNDLDTISPESQIAVEKEPSSSPSKETEVFPNLDPISPEVVEKVSSPPKETEEISSTENITAPSPPPCPPPQPQQTSNEPTVATIQFEERLQDTESSTSILKEHLPQSSDNGEVRTEIGEITFYRAEDFTNNDNTQVEKETLPTPIPAAIPAPSTEVVNTTTAVVVEKKAEKVADTIELEGDNSILQNSMLLAGIGDTDSSLNGSLDDDKQSLIDNSNPSTTLPVTYIDLASPLPPPPEDEEEEESEQPAIRIRSDVFEDPDPLDNPPSPPPQSNLPRPPPPLEDPATARILLFMSNAVPKIRTGISTTLDDALRALSNPSLPASEKYAKFGELKKAAIKSLYIADSLLVRGTLPEDGPLFEPVSTEPYESLTIEEMGDYFLKLLTVTLLLNEKEAQAWRDNLKMLKIRLTRILNYHAFCNKGPLHIEGNLNNIMCAVRKKLDPATIREKYNLVIPFEWICELWDSVKTYHLRKKVGFGAGPGRGKGDQAGSRFQSSEVFSSLARSSSCQAGTSSQPDPNSDPFSFSDATNLATKEIVNYEHSLLGVTGYSTQIFKVVSQIRKSLNRKRGIPTNPADPPAGINPLSFEADLFYLSDISGQLTAPRVTEDALNDGPVFPSQKEVAAGRSRGSNFGGMDKDTQTKQMVICQLVHKEQGSPPVLQQMATIGGDTGGSDQVYVLATPQQQSLMQNQIVGGTVTEAVLRDALTVPIDLTEEGIETLQQIHVGGPVSAGQNLLRGQQRRSRGTACSSRNCVVQEQQPRAMVHHRGISPSNPPLQFYPLVRPQVQRQPQPQQHQQSQQSLRHQQLQQQSLQQQQFQQQLQQQQQLSQPQQQQLQQSSQPHQPLQQQPSMAQQRFNLLQYQQLQRQKLQQQKQLRLEQEQQLRQSQLLRQQLQVPVTQQPQYLSQGTVTQSPPQYFQQQQQQTLITSVIVPNVNVNHNQSPTRNSPHVTTESELETIIRHQLQLQQPPQVVTPPQQVVVQQQQQQQNQYQQSVQNYSQQQQQQQFSPGQGSLANDSPLFYNVPDLNNPGFQ